MSSKPGLEKNVWSIVGTPDFSVREITKVPMQDPETGAFIPQDKSYLKTGPGRVLAEEFRKLLGQKLETELSDFTVLGGQRWGSALPGLSRNPVKIIIILNKNVLIQEIPVNDGSFFTVEL